MRSNLGATVSWNRTTRAHVALLTADHPNGKDLPDERAGNPRRDSGSGASGATSYGCHFVRFGKDVTR